MRADAVERTLHVGGAGAVAADEAVVAEVWEPRVNDYCHRCDFRLSCPAWTEGKGAFLP